jgi:hypothetical protein
MAFHNELKDYPWEEIEKEIYSRTKKDVERALLTQPMPRGHISSPSRGSAE